MKKINYIFAIAFMACAFALSCTKEIDAPIEEEVVISETAEQITISATISNALTKVGFTPTYSGGKPTEMALTWETGDIIRVYDHADRSKYDDFTLKSSCNGLTTGEFTGTPTQITSATAFDVEVYNASAPTYADQTQPSDGVTSDLKYLASATNIADYSDITFTDFSSVLAITAKMPSTAVAAKIKSVDITASDAIFNGGTSLSITFDTIGDADGDGILHFFATLPQGNQDIAAGTTLLFHFNAPGEAHDVYTRFVELGATTFTTNKLNTININATQSGTHAGKTSDDGSTAGKAYLIGDKYQMQAISLTTTKQYYKLVDDIDMDGVSWTSLNAAGTDIIDLDGNGKTISNLQASLFDDLNGKVSDLIISDATIDGGSSPSGILANTIKTAASTVDNVDINNSSITATAYAGGLICNITKGKTTISNVDITDTNVSGTLTGGILGFPQEVTDITNCHFVGNGTSSTPASKGVITAGNQYAGGIIGATTAGKAVTITGCSVEAAKIVSSYNKVGGAVGHLRSGSSVEDTTVGEDTNHVIITLTTNGQNIGGFIGLSEGGNVTNCKAYTDITAVANYVGGFFGHMNGGEVTGCKSYGTVRGPSYIGGFAGQISAATTLSGNESRCSITATGTYIGGFAGRIVGSVSLTNCKYYNGRVWTNIGENTASYVGGFAGYIGATNEAFTGTISGCLVSGATIDSIKYKDDGKTPNTSGTWVGGFAGGIGHSTPANNTGTIELCRVHSTKPSGGQYTAGFAGVSYVAISKCCTTGGSDGLVHGYGASVGGFVGYQQGRSLEYCYSTVNVETSNKNNVGGFVGQAKATTITECYSSGSITGTSGSTGGVIGYLLQNSSLKRCIRWNHSNNATMCGSIKTDGGDTSAADSDCAVKGSGDSTFKTFVTDKSWDIGSSIWNYGNPPSLVGMPS